MCGSSLTFCMIKETALLSIKNDVHHSLSRGEPTALVLLDLSAAFDTIGHATLHDCLSSWFSVGGTALKWFAPYLCDRLQAIKIGLTLSDFRFFLVFPRVRSLDHFCFPCTPPRLVR